MNKSGWIQKSLLISAGLALAVGFGLSMFFKIHQELDIAPSRAWELAAVVFFISALVTTIYFKMRTER